MNEKEKTTTYEMHIEDMLNVLNVHKTARQGTVLCLDGGN